VRLDIEACHGRAHGGFVTFVVRITFCLTLLWPISAAAQATHDAQLWTQVILTAPIAPQWLVHLEAQPRWSDDVSELNHAIARGAVGRRVAPGVSMWGGYAWIPRTLGPGTRHEQRIWQQVSASLPVVRRWAPSMRLRTEQRFLDGWEDSSHRLRIMGRLVRPLDAAGTWNVATWNEGMITLDDTVGGPWQGFDQNRLFAGLMRRMSSAATIEGGYLWHTTKPPTSARAHAHVGFVWLNVVM
jgi:hypothetical protein